MTFPNGMPLDEDAYWARLAELDEAPVSRAENEAMTHNQWHRENGMAGCPWDCAASEAFLHQHDAEDDEPDGDTAGSEGQALVEPPATPRGHQWPTEVEPPF